MRITNTMMINSTMRNVNSSKTNLNSAENQMGTEKKITRPSDDPIIAIRALSLRSSLSEISMYLTNNIPEAESWIGITESALDNMDSALGDIYELCTQGASDQFTIENRSAIIQVLNQYKKLCIQRPMPTMPEDIALQDTERIHHLHSLMRPRLHQ